MTTSTSKFKWAAFIMYAIIWCYSALFLYRLSEKIDYLVETISNQRLINSHFPIIVPEDLEVKIEQI